MQFQIILPILGILLVLFSSSSLPPIVVALIYQEPEAAVFIYTFLLTPQLTGWYPATHRF